MTEARTGASSHTKPSIGDQKKKKIQTLAISLVDFGGAFCRLRFVGSSVLREGG